MAHDCLLAQGSHSLSLALSRKHCLAITQFTALHCVGINNRTAMGASMPQGVIHKVTSVSSRASGISLKVTSMKQATTLILEIWRINSSDLSETVLQDYQELQF